MNSARRTATINVTIYLHHAARQLPPLWGKAERVLPSPARIPLCQIFDKQSFHTAPPAVPALRTISRSRRLNEDTHARTHAQENQIKSKRNKQTERGSYRFLLVRSVGRSVGWSSPPQLLNSLRRISSLDACDRVADRTSVRYCCYPDPTTPTFIGSAQNRWAVVWSVSMSALATPCCSKIRSCPRSAVGPEAGNDM